MIHLRLLILMSALLLSGGGVYAKKTAETGIKVGTITFTGASAFKASRLKNLMVTRQSHWWRSRYYHEQVFQEDLNTIRKFYWQNGFLQASLDEPVTRIDSAGGRIDLTIGLHEGPVTQVGTVEFFGDSLTDKEIFRRLVKIHPGDTLRRKPIEKAVINLLSHFADRGFIEADISHEVRTESLGQTAAVIFNIQQGPQFKVCEIRMTGLKKTKPGVVRREFLFQHGEVLNYSKLMNTQRNLYETGLFQSVFVKPVPSPGDPPGFRSIKLEFEERKSIELNTSVGFGTVEKARVRLEAVNNNIAGTSRRANIAAGISYIGYYLESGITEPRTLGTRFRTDLGFFWRYRQEPGYQIRQLGGRTTFGRRFGRFVTFSLIYRHENNNLRDIQVSTVPDTLTSNLRSLGPSLVYDSRDNMFSPSLGTYLEIRNDFAAAVLNSSNSFARIAANYKHFHSLSPATVLAFAACMGWMSTFSESLEIPLNERFYTGGPNSVRGFGYQRLGPISPDRVPLGGKFQLVCNLIEIRQVLYKMVGMALFLDAGNVWPSLSDFNLKGVRYSPGAGLRANTPIGIVRLDFGTNPWPKGDEDWWQVYFNVGHTF